MWLGFTFAHCLGLLILGYKSFIGNEFKGWHTLGDLFAGCGKVTIIWAEGVDSVLHLLFICRYSILVSGLIQSNSLVMFSFGLFLSSLIKSNRLFMPGLGICLVLGNGFLMFSLGFCLSL